MILILISLYAWTGAALAYFAYMRGRQVSYNEIRWYDYIITVIIWPYTIYLYFKYYHKKNNDER